MGTSSSKSKEPKPSVLHRLISPGRATRKADSRSPATSAAAAEGSASPPAHAPSNAQPRLQTPTHTAEPEGSQLTTKYGRGFASEVALLQMMDGGSTEHNIERVLKKRAKQALGKKRSKAGVVNDSSGLYVDEEEREEHRRLLPRDGDKK